MGKYVIHKRSRTAQKVSYSGPTLDRAGLRDLYQSTYQDRAEAERISAILSEYNPVGFEVSEVKEQCDE